MVEVLTGYTNRTDVLVGLQRCQALAVRFAEGKLQPRPQVHGPRPHKLVHRLSPTRIDKLVAAYESGQTAVALAQTHGLSKSTVLRLLHERGVKVRTRGYRSS